MKHILLILAILIASSCSRYKHENETPIDIILIGGGIMSATLGTMLKELDPNLTMEIYEKLDAVALESSDAFNNAGTGHSAFCELNYTPELEDGSIKVTRAININEQFEVSKQFWAYQVKKNYLPNPRSFINNVPHVSFVWGDENVTYLKKRFEALQNVNLFKGMEYSEDHEVLKQWFPLVMNGRDKGQRVAATKMEIGTDVNFGSLTREMTKHLTDTHNTKLHLSHEVTDIKRDEKAGLWDVYVKDLKNDQRKIVKAKFVFIGAGGGALPLLEKSGIPEAKGLGGFPVGGQWLVTTNSELIEKHYAKVYGKASVGSPPMSVPHLDTRVIEGKKALLFGPFATFSTKFLKNGSWIDLPASINFGNIVPMLQAGIDNIPLTQYLVGQLMLSHEDKFKVLKDYFPEAKIEDWTERNAGQRVQVIKDHPEKGGILQFGTEVVSSADGSIVALLGASPGASTSPSIMIRIIEKSFSDRLATPTWQEKMRDMVPSYGRTLNPDAEFANQIRSESSKILGLKFIEL